MKVLKATEQQYNEINEVSKNYAYVKFIKDNFDNWVTSCNCKADKTYFIEVQVRLQLLEEIEYEPIPPIEDIEL